MSRKKRKPGRKASPLTVLRNAQPHMPGEKLDAHLRTLATAERLISGGAEPGDVDALGMQLNLGKIRSAQIDASLVADIFEPAIDALLRAQDRMHRTGRLALDGPGITAIRAALQPLQAIVDASSPLQMRAARRTLIDTLTGRKGSWREYESKTGTLT